MSGLHRIRTLTGQEFRASQEETLLDAALGQGVHLPHSCRNGQCGVCKTTLVRGEVDELRPQMALDAKDMVAKKILTCCCAARSDLTIDAEDVSALKDIKEQILPARIDRLVRHGDSLLECWLRLPPKATFDYLEGQYIDVVGPNRLRRSYSMANTSRSRAIQLFIRKVDGGLMSRYWFEEARVNDLLRLEGPKGTFFFRAPAREVVFLATGTGIAPIKAMLDALAQEPTHATNHVLRLYWGNRREEDFFWTPEYPELNLIYTPVLSRPSGRWKGRIGYVQEAMMNDCSNPGDMAVYACGSLAMIEDAKARLLAAGLPERSFFSDAFVSSGNQGGI